MSEEMPQVSAHSFSSDDRIRQLNDIDKDVTKLINSAGLAIKALTNTPGDSTMPHSSLESHKTQFKEATTHYFALLSSIDVRLRRQVYALEEASLLAPDSNSRTDAITTGAGAAGVVSGASNHLDISWLNSRKNTVGQDKEAELWAAARKFVENLDETEEYTQMNSNQSNEAEKMQVD
ncbi:hypothetical protein N7495_004956 [Penicillium taxi]|uniref:uncharacterized protein n=1 Tax=Penicillium taxi TaxID=168475 RepID=UPI0025451E5C|nr:uncharacterized protein N7495_004956 [Penicillium taxi]KAJ5893265.1 hypothetical protein N7495_004956 [Penicillium taxi]